MQLGKHTQTLGMKKGVLFKVQNKRHSLPDVDDPFRFCTAYGILELISF